MFHRSGKEKRDTLAAAAAVVAKERVHALYALRREVSNMMMLSGKEKLCPST
jgi:hypothetical protein